MRFPCGHEDEGVQDVSQMGHNRLVCQTCGCPSELEEGTVWITYLGHAVSEKEAKRLGVM